MNIIDEMAIEALSDSYFLHLFHTTETLYWNRLLGKNIVSDNPFTNEEFSDILTFADILSLSSNDEHRNLALKIISCLKFYYDVPKYRYFAKGIMIRLGNFPGYKLVSTNDDDNSPLQLDLSIEKHFKETINKDPYSSKVFTDAQYYMLDELQDKNHFSFSGPTSFGKSFIITSFIKSIISNNKRGVNIVLLVPTRALVSQTLRKIKDTLEDIDGYFLSSSPEIPLLLRRHNSHYVFVFTPERLLQFFSNSTNPSIEYVFIDEAQKVLSDDTRSVVYYHAISLAERKSCKLFFSSPNIKNVDVFLKLFNKTSAESDSTSESPVCQSRVFIDMIGKSIKLFSDIDSVFEIEYNLPTNLPELLATIAHNIDPINPKSLIYCNTIDDTIELAKKMAAYLNRNRKSAISPTLLQAADEISAFIHKDYYLVELIKAGVGFHFGKLPQRIRDIVERLYDNGDLQYLFCTSTLLEGVNLPAQNIFILNNQIGNKDIRTIDFWNLAGRAGRLAKELCGNVICVKWTSKEGRWATPRSIEIIKNKIVEDIDADVITGRQNFYLNIFRAAQGQAFTRTNVNETQRRVYNAYSNVLISHFLDNQTSLLRNEFQRKVPEGAKAINELNKKMAIPSIILCRFPLIKATYQNEIWNTPSSQTPSLDEPTYDNCLAMLELFYDLYHWDIEESGGKNPMLPRGDRRFLRHYASLMKDWMNSKSINEIIAQTLYNYKGRTVDFGYLPDGSRNIELFRSNNTAHINYVINKTISEIDSIIRFTLKNYFENYYCIIKTRDGIGSCGNDWALYLEHGTSKKELIEIQKIGVPRHLSKLFYDDFGDFCVFDDDRDLVSISQNRIYEKLKEGEKTEYSELVEALEDNYILGNHSIGE